MSKDALSDYDATAANNTDVGGINTAEGMSPALVNDAIRELMSHLKETDVGTSPLTSPQITTLNLGHASDTTIARSGAGVVTIEGVEVTTNSGTQNLTNKTFTDATTFSGEINANGGLNEDHNAGALTNTNATLTLDCHNGNNFSVTLAANVTSFVVSNLPASGTAFFFTLKVTQDSTARSISWGSAVKWAAGSAPSLSSASGAVDVFTFYTIDSGTTIYGFTAGQALA